MVMVMCFVITAKMYSQGFDWQGSSRLPFQQSNKYFGVALNYNYTDYIGKLPLSENGIVAPDMDSGMSNSVAFGLCYEQWNKNNDIAYTLFADVSYSNLSFVSHDTVPLKPDLFAYYDYLFNTHNVEISFATQVKWRPFYSNHFYIAGKLQLGKSFLLSENTTEEIANKHEIPPFSTIPPSYTREMQDIKYNLNDWKASISLALGYDIDVSINQYFSPQIGCSVPLHYLGDRNLYSVSLFFRLNYFFAL